jgi:hypothetical protein
MIKSLLLLGVLLLASNCNLTGQTSPGPEKPAYREGSVWIVEFMRTKYGATDRYMEHLADDWKAALDEAKKQGLVLSYKAFLGPPANKEDWDVMTMIEVKDLTSPTEFYNRLGAIHAAIIGSTTRDEEATKRDPTFAKCSA